MFKNKKIVLFLLVLPLVAVLVAPKVALADDDSDWVKNIPIIGGVVDFASDPGGWITDRFAEAVQAEDQTSQKASLFLSVDALVNGAIIP